MRNDAIVVTAEDNWPNDLNFSVENSDSRGSSEVKFHWVAFDVVP